MHPSPVDLYLRITTRYESGTGFLVFELMSPSGRIERRRAGRSLPLPHDIANLSRQFSNELEGLLAGVDTEIHPLDRKDIEQRLRTIGKDLYRKLLPAPLREVFDHTPRLDDLSLLVESDEQWFPWEILHTYGDREDFLCLKYRMGRWLADTSDDERLPKTSFAVSRFLGIDAETVATADPWSSPARTEREAEIQVLRDMAASTPLLDEIPLAEPRHEAVVRALRAGGFQWLHYAGHGSFPESGSADLASLALEQGKLQARDLVGDIEEALARDRPFVFLNACRLSRQGPAFAGLGGWPSTLIDVCGCGGFLAPSWAVPHHKARDFARRFYDHARRGALGEAVRQARLEPLSDTDEAAPVDATALAYVYYGHPNASVVWGQSGSDEPAAVVAPRPRADTPRVVTHRSKRSTPRDTGGDATQAAPLSGDTTTVEAARPAVRHRGRPSPFRLSKPSLAWAILAMASPLALAVLGASTHRSREIMLRISHQTYPVGELWATGFRALSDGVVNGLTAMTSSEPWIRSGAWGLLGLAVICGLASRSRSRSSLWKSSVAALAAVVLTLGVLVYPFSLRARHPDEQRSETAALCSSTPRARPGQPVPITDQLVVASCIWLSHPTSTHEQQRQGLSGLAPLFLLASLGALGCAWRIEKAPGWRGGSRSLLLGAHWLILFMVLRQVPLAHAYAHWGLEYPTIAIEGDCHEDLRRWLDDGRCCAFDVSAGADQKVLLVWGARCPSPGERRGPENGCRWVTGPVRAIAQACGP